MNGFGFEQIDEITPTSTSPISLSLAQSSPTNNGDGNTLRPKVAFNVKSMNVVPNNNTLSLFSLSPKGKHFMEMEIEYDQIEDISNNSNLSNTGITKIDIIKDKKKKIKFNSYGKNIGFGKLMRQKSNSDSLSQKKMKKKKMGTPFCLSCGQYYIHDTMLVQFENEKNMEEIVKKGDMKKLLKHANERNVEQDIFFLMESEVEIVCDELEEKINRLFNKNGGHIFVGVTGKKRKKTTMDLGGGHHKKSGSLIFNKKNIQETLNEDNIIKGIKLSSQDRHDLRTRIINDILKGFTPQIPHLVNNFDLKYIPVVSRNGQIMPNHFVMKITVIAPILGLNGETLTFRTKDGFSHVIDFDSD